MSNNKNILTVVGVVVALAVLGGIIYYSQRGAQTGSTDEEALNELNELLETGAGIPDVGAPSANPLDKVAPSENPIEKTNPFNGQNEYENPFE